MVLRSLRFIRSMIFLNRRLKIEALRDLHWTFRAIRSWSWQHSMPFLTLQEGASGKEKSQNMWVIVLPRTHKRLHADSSRIRGDEQDWAIQWEMWTFCHFWHNVSALIVKR
jgi:hypothetical protein